MQQAPAILWLRQDLRLADNPALQAAVDSGRPVIPLYILDPAPGLARGGASLWWLHHSLSALAQDLAARGATLMLARGDSAAVLDRVIAETGAQAVFWNRLYDPVSVARDKAIKADLRRRGLSVQSCKASLLFEPWEVATQAGGPFKVFTPFWKTCLAKAPGLLPLDPAPERIAGTGLAGEALDDWRLTPTAPDWSGGFGDWRPGEAGARSALDLFVARGLKDYAEGRDRPGEPGTSRLSPHLHFGEIGPRQVWNAVEASGVGGAGARVFESELGWREFTHHVLFHFPSMPQKNLRPGFETFPWREDPAGLAAWRRGLTGYPMVDAGMRELWTTGWMHNRVRMLTASFLVKDLMIDWRTGAAWFHDCLVDADLSQNVFNWQWTAGCGFDAAPYFRIFNPAGQGERFDPDGRYVRRWCPELARLPDRWIHRPFEAPKVVLAGAGIVLGRDYPKPIVDHAQARDEALAAFKALRA